MRRAVAAWSEGQVLGFNIAEANERSNTVTTVTMNGFDPAALQRYCKEKCGVVLGTGIGDLQGQRFVAGGGDQRFKSLLVRQVEQDPGERAVVFHDEQHLVAGLNRAAIVIDVILRQRRRLGACDGEIEVHIPGR